MFKRQPSALPALLLVALCLGFNACSPTPEPTPTATLPPAPVPQTATPASLPPTVVPSETPTPTASSTLPPVELLLTPTTTDFEVAYAVFKTSDGVQLMGKLYGEGEMAVVLAHQGSTGANHRDWQFFAELIAGRGFAALAFDFRGYGNSQGQAGQVNIALRDIQAALDYLEGLGYRRFVCMGASLGGTACLKAATENDLAGLVVISSPMSLGPPTKVTPEELAELTVPKLYITSENDRSEHIPSVMAEMHELSAAPKRLRTFPGQAHGTELFDGPYGEEFTGELLLFLEGLR